jgi:hypothetical protein
VFQLAHSDAVVAQSSSVATPVKQFSTGNLARGIRSSKTIAQVRTEAILSKDVGSFGIPIGRELDAGDVLGNLQSPTFIDLNLDGVFDTETKVYLHGHVSMRRSLSHTLLQNDAVYMVMADGSISIISIDDEYESDYLQRITYDVTPIANTMRQASSLSNLLQQTVLSDSWEQNGSGNGTLSLYPQNDRILLAITQSYRCHSEIQKQLNSILALGGAMSSKTVLHGKTNNRIDTASPSTVVLVPEKNTASALRSRRGFARPGSGTSGGFGGGGNAGGVF